ncbi:ankyrin repeat domain-containing protein [Verrucomicrobia bacterium]|nr:ankyrin repeat domain-containing protein [Verrucomicrobiota bacterium]
MLSALLVFGCGRQKAKRNEVMGYTPLIAAIVDRNDEVAKELIQNGVDINAGDLSRMTPLHHAVSCGSVEMVNLLLDSGADVNLKDEAGQTAMRLASGLAKFWGLDDQIIAALREHGATESGSAK